MRMPHTRSHWIMVALVLAALLLALNEAHGQSAGAAAAFEGRPAMAGAQAGLGAQAGPPQGGIGVQGSTGDMVAAAPGKAKPRDDVVLPRDGTAKPKDRSLAADERSAVKKGKRGAKETIRRSRTGVGGIGAREAPGG